ncbi:MAG TPA: hypothetical protein VF950_16630 [Planctomycetota bacterium]
MDRVFAALILLAAGCAPPSKKDAPAAASGDLEVSFEIDSTSLKPREGDLAGVVFRIRNGSSNAIVLHDLVLLRDYMLPGSTASVASWQFAQAGYLNYLPEIDEWEYDRRRKAEKARPVFNSGMLLPGERIVTRAKLRLLDMPKDFQFHYFELSSAELMRRVYWEVRAEKQIRFRHLVGADLAEQLKPKPLEDSPSLRQIIYPFAEEVRSSQLRKSVRVDAPLQPRAFTLAQAVRLAGVPAPRAGESTYCQALEGWILPSPTGHVLVTPKDVVPLPEIRQLERVFFHVDVVGVSKIQVAIEKASLATELSSRRWPIVKQERDEWVSSKVYIKRADHFLFIQVADFLRLCAELRALGAALDVDLSAEGGGVLLITR